MKCVEDHKYRNLKFSVILLDDHHRKADIVVTKALAIIWCVMGIGLAMSFHTSASETCNSPISHKETLGANKIIE